MTLIWFLVWLVGALALDLARAGTVRRPPDEGMAAR
jgi:hypothetical protein